MSDATTETIVQENASTNDVEMTTTATTAKTPTKSTPSKRRSKLERERAESEEIIKSMGGSVEGGRRTRSSARGAVPPSPITPPAAKKARVTTPRRGRGSKKEDKQPVDEHSSDNENEKDSVDNGRSEEESNDKSKKEENNSKGDVPEPTKEVAEAEKTPEGTEKPEDNSKTENKDVAIKKDEVNDVEKDVAGGGENLTDKMNDLKTVSSAKEIKSNVEKMEVDGNNDDLVATSQSTEAQQKIETPQTKVVTDQENCENIVDKKLDDNESKSTVAVTNASSENSTIIANDITINKAKINNETPEKPEQKITDNKISNTTENKTINSIQTSADDVATITTTATAEKSQELSPTKKIIDSSVQQSSPSSAVQNSDSNAINDKNQNTENTVTLPITKVAEPPVIEKPAAVVATVEASPEKLSTVDEKKTNTVSNEEPSIADSTPNVTAPL